MDTQFWGPPGHKLLHSISFLYSYTDEYEYINKKDVISFFKSIQHVLPCIYCRRSYKKYYKDLPIREYIKHNDNNENNKNNNKNLFKWMYLLHNKINDKLRKQGYNTEKDPSFEKVYSFYKKFVKKINCMIGWDFLYSIIFNYPEYDFELSEIRKNGYITFFNKLALFIPNKKLREVYSEYIDKNPIQKYMKTRKNIIKWMYYLEKKIKKGRCCSFENRCKKIEKYRVNKCKNKTCRSK